MNIGILGTGIVAQTFAARLEGLGHAVMLGTRDVRATLDRTEPDYMGNPGFGTWQLQHAHVKLATFAEAAAFGEIVLNCTLGTGSLDALNRAGAENLNGKILVDIANTLDFTRGMPPTLFVCNTDSLAEQIQIAYPNVKVVKSLNTVNASVMVYPNRLAGGDHTMFVAGNDTTAKAEVTTILKDWFGWTHVLDLGDITAARGMEMYMPLWLRLFGSLGTPMYNVKVVR